MAPLILVVDDQLGVRRLAEAVFTGVGYRVAVAAHGQEALAISAADEPALAIVDIKMPVMDGLETLRALKSRHPDLPVFMMTAVGDCDRIEEALDSGASRCISKPFDIFELRKLVQDVINGR